ncbi:hypothetical protein Tco_1449772 [Tanacetum coccineum]
MVWKGIVFKPDGSVKALESIHMMDIYEDDSKKFVNLESMILFSNLLLVRSFKTFSNPLFEKKDDFPSRNDESILKEEVHKETLKSYLNPLFEDDEEIISIECGDSNNDEWKRILYGEDFERMDSDSDKTKDFDKSSSSVFKSLSDEFKPGDLCYEDFHVSDALFSTINEDKVFNPGILVDKNSKVHEPNVLPTLPTRSSEMMLEL